MTQRPLVVTPGDPLGVGPEVACRALVEWAGSVVLVGHGEAVRSWAARIGVDVEPVDDVRAVPGAVALLDPGDDAEPVEVASLRVGVRACLEGRARGLVTGPIHKGRLAARGFAHPGHTEFLAELCGVSRPVMAFVGGRVRVALVTVHIPVGRVAAALDVDVIRHTITMAHEALVRQLGLQAPRLAVCGLNPHAGDGGVIGHEDLEVVAPAVERARAAGIEAMGPMSAEAAFRVALTGGCDLVVAMYHDQGLAPLKALEWRDPTEPRSVNWTLGLPIVRCGVDHGTADDIAGQGVADPASMVAALELAESLTTP